MRSLLIAVACLASVSACAEPEQRATFAERFGDWIETTDGRNADSWPPRNAAVLYLDGPFMVAVDPVA
jgi:hypothetical protein